MMPVRPIAPQTKTLLLEEDVPALSTNITSHFDNLTVDKLMWIFYGIRPDTLLSGVGLAGAGFSDVLKFMRKSRLRVENTIGNKGGLHSLDPNLTNVHTIAVVDRFPDGYENYP